MDLPGRLFGAPLGDPVELVAYDPDWPRRFESLRAQLTAALGPSALRIDHVGSTAVPGLEAKPVIDVQVSVADLEDEASYRPALERLGVGLRYREPDWAYFRPTTPPRTHHVHVTPAGGRREREQLLFVAFLRADHDARDAYAALKRELAASFAADRLAYTAAKTDFIRGTLDRAEDWARRTGWQP